MLKAYKYRIYPNNKQKYRLQKHLVAAVLFITRHLHTEKGNTKMVKKPLLKQTVIITATGN